jgi:uncharacterized membrane protein YbhN (UPF0104 family)
MTDSGTPPASWPEQARPALRRSSLIRGALGLAVAVAAFIWALPSFAPYREVWSKLAGVPADFAMVLAVVGMANLVAPAAAQLAALPGLRLTDAVSTDWATSAVTNTVPAGSALAIGMTWSMYRSYGLTRRAIARSVLITGVWDTFVKFGTPLLALAWLSTQRPVGPGMIQAAVAGGGMFLVVIALSTVLLAGPAASHVLGSLLDRLPLTGGNWPARLNSLRDDTIWLLRDRGKYLTFWTLAGHANLYLLLVVCIRAVGVASTDLSMAAILAAFAFGRLLTALPVTPGGLGIMEVGLTGALTTVGDPSHAAIVAAVLLYRFMTFLVPIPLGAIAWLAWTSRSPAAPGGGADQPPVERHRQRAGHR